MLLHLVGILTIWHLRTAIDLTVHGWSMLVLHSTSPLVMAVRVAILSITIAVVVPTRVRVTDNTIEWHATTRVHLGSIALILLANVLSERGTTHLAAHSASLLPCRIANLKLVHQKAKRGDQLDQICVL